MGIENDKKPSFGHGSHRGTIRPPARRFLPPAPHKAATPDQPPQSAPPKADVEDLAKVRQDLGFDDIPLASSNEESFRDVLGAWVEHTFHLTHPDNRVARLYHYVRNKQFKSWKDDLTWALRADLPEDAIKNRRKQTKQTIEYPDRPTTPLNEHIQPAQPIAPVHPKESTPPTDAKSIEINISFDSLPKVPVARLKTRISNLITKMRGIHLSRRVVAITGAVVIVIASVAIWRFVPGMPGTANADPGKTKSSETVQQPTYTTLTPNGKSINSLGGWKRISPPDKDPVFAYADTINGVPIAISEQPIPDSFQPDIDKNVATLASGYLATDKIATGSVTVYVGTSGQGPQSAIFAKNNLLIFIKSSQKVSDNDWASYANSLN